jgi:AcrR family transcriptional regulator
MPAEERRSAIVAATLPLVLEHGDRVTSRQIAEAAGIAEGTIFRVFADKEALLDAVIESALDPAPLETAIEAIDLGLPFEAALAAAIDVLQRRVFDIVRLSASVGARLQNRPKRPMQDSPALAALLGAHSAHLRTDPQTAAHYLRSMTLALTHPLLNEHPKAVSEVVDLFLHGVGSATC